MICETINNKPTPPLGQLAGIWLTSGLAVVGLALIYIRYAGVPAEAISNNEIIRLIQGAVFVATAFLVLSLLGTDIKSIYSSLSSCRARSIKLAAKYFLLYLLAAAAIIGALSLVAMLVMKLGLFSLDAFNAYHARATAEKLAEKNYLRDILTGSPVRFLIYLFSTCILIPIEEEIFTRRLFYLSLRQKLGVSASLVLSSLAFGIAHLGAAAVPAFVFSIFLGWIYEKHQDLTANILIHGLINFTVVLTMIYLSH